MKREEAITILKEERWYMSRYSEEYKKAYDMAIDALKQTAWIPVGERLPDLDQKVIICTEDGQITDGCRWDKDGWFCACGEYNCGTTEDWLLQIVAWMPLPTPYKGGEKE